MRHTDRLKPTNTKQTATYAIRYSPVRGAWTSDFPVSQPYQCEVEPDSHAIRLLDLHDMLEVGYCYEGAGILVVEGRIMPFDAGDVSIVNDQEVHMSRCSEDRPSRWVYFWMDPAALLTGIPNGLAVANQDALAGEGFPNVISCRRHPDTCRLVHAMLEEFEHRQENYRVAICGLAAVLMTHLHRLCAEPAACDVAPQRTGLERIAPALQHMVNHYAEAIAVKELAELCCLSLAQFHRLFLAATGEPPLSYLAQVRTRMAAAILQEQPDKPITEVATDVGFEAINTFNRQFRKALGTSPREWRRQSHNHVAPKRKLPSRPRAQKRINTGRN